MTLLSKGLICAACGLGGTFLVLVLVYVTIVVLKIGKNSHNENAVDK